MTPSSRSRSSSPGVGNAWLQDDAFGGECARRLAGPRGPGRA